MKRIGIMGGTFDPIHQGHLMLGKQALEEYHLDAVWYMPSKTPPHKKDHAVTEARHRCAMVEAAIRCCPQFILSDFELKREGGNTYTADTLRLLKEQYPDTEFFFIMGEDSVLNLEKWYMPEYVMKSVTILAAGRDCGPDGRSLEEQIRYLTKKYGARILILHCPELDAASADIRESLESGRIPSRFVPEEVLRYIRENHLYGEELHNEL